MSNNAKNSRYVITPAEKAEIETACQTAVGAGEKARLEVLRLFALGKSPKEISAATSYHKAHAYTLLQKYHDKGIDAIIGRSYWKNERHMTKKYELTPEQISEIKSYDGKKLSELAARRLKIFQFRADGKSNEEIIKATGYSEATVIRLLHDYMTDGLETVLGRPRTGKRQYMAQNYELTPEQIAELKQGYETATKEHVARRFRVLLMRAEGKTIGEVADATGFSTENVVRLTKEYRKNGVAAVIGKPRPSTSFKHKFTAKQRNEIAAARKKVEALWLRCEGRTMEEIGAAVGLHPMTVMQLVRKYQEQGISSVVRDGRKDKK